MILTGSLKLEGTWKKLPNPRLPNPRLPNPRLRKLKLSREIINKKKLKQTEPPTERERERERERESHLERA
jgi:hypothetical protein